MSKPEHGINDEVDGIWKVQRLAVIPDNHKSNFVGSNCMIFNLMSRNCNSVTIV